MSFIKYLLIIGSGLIINNSLLVAQTIEHTDDVEVIIIGAGMSGLSAARELNKHGIKCIILEARDRVGGRVHTVKPWGIATDLGASWIHQINNNPLTTLVKKYKIPVVHTDYSHDNTFSMLKSATVFDADGKKMGDERFQTAITQIKHFKTYLDKHGASYSVHFSVTDSLAQYMKDNPMNQDSLDLLTHINGDAGEYENGASLSDTSFKVALDTHPTTSGSDVIFKNGYAQLLKQLTKNIPIVFNQVVTKIAYDPKGVTVSAGGKQYHAKYLISTLPLGVLKTNTIEFNPTLPQDKLAAIQRIGMGTYNKTYLLFDTVFWEKDTEWLVFLSKNNKQNEDFEIMNYYSQSKQPILLVFTTGAFASDLEKLSDQAIVERIMKTLKRTYGDNIPKPKSFLVTHWGTDPYSRGSFSYPRVGSSNKDYELLSKPVGDRVFFAGEATSTTDPSTVTGAYLSGIRAAKEIVEIRGL